MRFCGKVEATCKDCSEVVGFLVSITPEGVTSPSLVLDALFTRLEKDLQDRSWNKAGEFWVCDLCTKERLKKSREEARKNNENAPTS